MPPTAAPLQATTSPIASIAVTAIAASIPSASIATPATVCKPMFRAAVAPVKAAENN
jgi:hypothetical protein